MEVLITLSLIITLFCAAYYYFERKLHYFKDKGVPYVPGWPIFGNMASVVFQRQHFSHMMLDMYSTHQDAKYVGVFDFVRPIILLRDPDLIKTITIKNFDSFQNHFTTFNIETDPLFAGNLFSMKDDHWREARSMLSPAFTSSKMKAMFELIVECVNNLSSYVSKLPEDQRNMIDTKDLFTRFTNDAIATCAFGMKIDSLNDPTNQFYLYGKKATDFSNAAALIKFFIARSCPKILQLLKIRVVSDEVTNFFIDVVGKVVKMRDESGTSRPDMIQLMMDARSKDKKYLKLDIQEMTAQAFIFFFGGFDTTSTHMCILAHELAINPDIQKKLQDEIDRVMDESDGNPSYEIILGMSYLDAVFNETSRRHSQAILMDRLCNKAFELPPALPGAKPFTIQPGMNVWISGTSIHMDPKYFDNPEKFDPDRYYKKKISINDEFNLNFGMGPRGCIGNRFAILETKVLFVYLLSKFTLVANSKTCSPLKYSKSSFNIKPDQGFLLAIEPRCNQYSDK